MTAATTKQLTFEHTAVKSLSSLILELLQNTEGGKWQGTAHTLCESLSVKLSPRGLVVRLKKSHDELKRHGVKVGYKKLKGAHIIVLSSTLNFTQNVTNGGTSIDATPEKSVFATPTVIKYPFKWRYGTIKELSDEEKKEVNQPIKNARKKHLRHCQLCGGPNRIEFRKKSDGNSCLLCRSCAEGYVKKALALIQKSGDDL